jgi:hypothetical protein
MKINRKLTLCGAAATILLALPASASAGVFGRPLEGYWPMNEGSGQVVRDWSGNGNHGQLGASPTPDSNDPTWIRGVFGLGSGLSFDGNDFVAIRDDPTLEPARITVETWFRRSGSPDRVTYLVSKGGDRCEAGSYGLYTTETGRLAFYIYDGTNWRRSPEADQSVWDGRWHHVVGTFDGSMVRLFVDGQQVGSGTPTSISIGYAVPQGDGTIGGYRGSCALLFEGDMDAVRIWSRALPVSRIAAKARRLLASLRR